ncbi:hypothetical protein RCL1_008386 [Eukaryota sp. TZLM3-RCL]
MFDFDVVHIEGASNFWADLLSRLIPNPPQISLIETSVFMTKIKEQQQLEMTELLATHEGATCVDDFLTYQNKIIVPSSMRTTVLEMCHSDALAGPRGIKESLNAILYWKTLTKDLQEYVFKCLTCQKVNPKPTSTDVPSTGALWAFKPFECVHIDTIGPFPRDRNGNCYIFTFVDAFTRFTILAAAPSHTAIDAANAFFSNVLATFGIPLSIRTDNEPEYANQVLNWITTRLNIQHHYSIPHHHESNGLVERQDREVLTLLKKLLLDLRHYDEWSEILLHIQLILNSTVSTVTKMSPFSLIFGSDISPRRSF